MNERIRSNMRSAIYELGGIYLLYLAYQMFQNRAESSGGEYVTVLAAAAAFLIIGIGMISFGFYILYKVRKQDMQAKESGEAAEEQIVEK